ncbi:hypothetical protein BX667DRAFT_516691 [Coemansia mojavensis]|nr:hypothetical protein BX667DRAFT_516691 [Coemansia mojavensis]
MSQNTPMSAQTGSTDELLAKLKEQLAAYDALDQEASRLKQEQQMLENYVKNLMDSNINYYETFDDSEESDFEFEVSKKKARAARSKQDKKGQSPVASDSKTSRASETTSTATDSPKAEGHKEDSLERQETLLIPPSPPTSSEKDEKSKELSEGGCSDESEASDAYEEPEEGSDYNDEVVVVVGKRGKAPKAATSPNPPSANGKAAISKNPRKQPKTAKNPPTKPKTPTNTTRKNAGLGELLSSPPSSRLSRSKLQSSGSSSSSLGSPVRSPSGIKRKATGTPLKELLKGSNVPRAGLSRRSLVKKV